MRSNFIVAACFLAIANLVSCRSASQPEGRSAPAKSSAEQATAEPPAQTETSADKRPLVVTYGDSLTQGVSGKSYPAFLQDLLDENGYSYRVDNQGVSGDTTTDGLARIDNVIAVKPALVVLEFGGNDGLRGVPVTATEQNLSEMIERIKAAHIPLVLAGITLPPNYGPEYVQPFTAIFLTVARKYKLRFLPFLLVHEYSHPNLMQPDGIHPNEEGNRLVAKDVYDLIRPMLGKKK